MGSCIAYNLNIVQIIGGDDDETYAGSAEAHQWNTGCKYEQLFEKDMTGPPLKILQKLWGWLREQCIITSSPRRKYWKVLLTEKADLKISGDASYCSANFVDGWAKLPEMLSILLQIVKWLITAQWWLLCIGIMLYRIQWKFRWHFPNIWIRNSACLLKQGVW